MLLLKPFKPLINLLLPATRQIDNVLLSVETPQEEEFAIASTMPFSFYQSFSFPNASREYFQRYVLLKTTDREIEKLKEFYRYFVCKLAALSNRNKILLKNPVNTARISLLKEIFPRARFIHITRNPYRILNSTVNLHKVLHEATGLQDIQESQIKSDVLLHYKQLMAAYFEQSLLLEKNELVEVNYDDLLDSPAQELERIYGTLGISLSAKALSQFSQYLSTLGQFKRNQFQLSSEDEKRIQFEWSNIIDKIGAFGR